MRDEEIIELLRDEIRSLKETLTLKEQELEELVKAKHTKVYNGLSSEEITRYSRQMLLPDISVEGQKNLKDSKVLIVGAGGLGCPSSLYLASAGIGEITVVDYDDVELTNLHRQVLHSEFDIDTPKVYSACDKLRRINSNIKIKAIHEHISNETAKELFEHTKYDVVLDCTDNVATRYLLNDVCVLNDIPLVSGSALQFEGQLTVYNYLGGPCYRCLFPVPPDPETVTNCGDGGVLGPVPGVMGTLQALEAIKILANIPGVLSKRMLIFDGAESIFRNIKLRNRNPNCAICGEKKNVIDLIDYEQFCGSNSHDKVTNIDILSSTENIGIHDFVNLKNKCLVLDVRPHLEYAMCHLDNCVNIPYHDIQKAKIDSLKELLVSKAKETDGKNGFTVLVLCRRGNDSQRAVSKLQQLFSSIFAVQFVNIRGGLHAYAKHIDPDFPVY